MLPGLENIAEDELVRWIETSIADNANIHGRGYQGHVYRFDGGGHRLIIKAASGRGALRWLRRALLRREHRIYKRLAGFRGSPRCYGLLRGRYLVLEYIEGVPMRHSGIADQKLFFERLLEYIQELHRRGVAHADLKRKDNLLVVDRRLPCLVDFGAAVAYRPGFAPLNHYLYDLARKFDYNAWIKLKYQGRLEDISEADRIYFNWTRVEVVAKWIKSNYLRLKHRLQKRRPSP